MTDVPERIWAQDADKDARDYIGGGWWDDEYSDASLEYVLKAIADTSIATLEAQLEKAKEALQWAFDTLEEINVSNYDHDQVCSLNEKSVEVALGVRATLAELEADQ